MRRRQEAQLVTGRGDVLTSVGLVPFISTTLPVVCSDVRSRGGDKTEQQRSDNLSQLLDIGRYITLNFVMSVAKLVSKRAHQVPGMTGSISDPAFVRLTAASGKLTISEHFFEVPLNHASPLDGSLRLFARSIERFEKPVGVVEEETKPLPWRMCLNK